MGDQQEKDFMVQDLGMAACMGRLSGRAAQGHTMSKAPAAAALPFRR